MATGNEIQLARKNIVGLLESQKAQITMALPKHLTADRLCRTAVTEMSKNPKLFDCTPTSILASIIMAAQLGFEVGVNGQAYLVPYYDNKKQATICQLIPGWQGFVDLISRAGRASVWTGAVRGGDFFDYTLGSSPNLEHKPGDEDGGEFGYVYAVGWVKGAQWPVIEVWSRAKVKKHLNSYNKVGDRHYALANENNLEMYGRKVALLQVMKYMPKSIEIQTAQNLEYSAGNGVQSLTLTNSGVQDAEYIDISGSDEQERTASPKIEEAMDKLGWNDTKKRMARANFRDNEKGFMEHLAAETGKMGTGSGGSEAPKAQRGPRKAAGASAAPADGQPATEAQPEAAAQDSEAAQEAVVTGPTQQIDFSNF